MRPETNTVVTAESHGLVCRVLIVDDIERERQDLARRVQQLCPDWEVVVAASAAEASRVVDEQAPFDVVITDMRMPEEDRADRPGDEQGIEVIQAARSRDPATWVIVLTAHPDAANLRAARETGADDYLDKDGIVRLPGLFRQQIEFSAGKAKQRRVEYEALRRLIEPDPEDVIARLTGLASLVEGDVAHVTLTDANGGEVYVDCSIRELAARGIDPRMCFEYVVCRHPKGNLIMLRQSPPMEPTDEDLARLRDEVREAAGGNDGARIAPSKEPA